MQGKEKKNNMKKVAKTVEEILIAMVLVIGLFAVYFGAVMQESYKLNPPTDAEIAENPALEVYRK